jgi:hypothetical protein
MQESYIVPTTDYWTYYDPALTKGYDNVIREELGSTVGLFPGIFK